MESNFKSMVDFLETYDWIYNFKLTDFFIDQVWEKIPEEWCNCLLSLTDEELNLLPYGNIKDSWPDSFKDFLQTAITFSLSRSHTNNEETLDIDLDLKRGMNPKKQHEVMKMATLVHEVAEKTGSDVIVDVGSGLGYLGQILHRKFNHKIIGVEGKQSHTSGADKRISSKIDGIINITCELDNTSESMENFNSVINEVLESFKSQSVSSSQTCSEISNSSGNYCAKDTIIPTNMEDIQKQIPIQEISSMIFSNVRCQSEVVDTCMSSSETVLNNCKCIHSVKSCHGNTRTINISDCSSHGPNVVTTNSAQTDSCHGNTRTVSVSDCSLNHPNVVTTICGQTDSCHGNNISEGEINQSCENRENIQQLQQEEQQNHEFNSASGSGKPDNNEPASRIPNILMIGLHCCGDLTPTMMTYFSKLEYVRGLCCVSCCYHRMKYNEQNGIFDNFPLSTKLKSVFDVKLNWNLNLYGMRLAAQETRTRWKTQSIEDHDYHMKNVAYRGVLEVFCRQDKYDSNKLFRKLTRKGDMTTFTSYIDAVLSRTKLTDTENDIDTNEAREKLHRIYNQFEKYFTYIEPFTALQVIVQPVIETLINIDRQAVLQEQGYHTDIVPVFDDRISPRNLAVVALKIKK